MNNKGRLFCAVMVILCGVLLFSEIKETFYFEKYGTSTDAYVWKIADNRTNRGVEEDADYTAYIAFFTESGEELNTCIRLKTHVQEGESIRIQYVLEDRGKIRARKENKILMVIKPLGLMMLMIILFVSALPKHGIGRSNG